MAGSKGSKYYDIFLDYSILLEHKQLGTIMDPYKFALLRSIHEEGSLKLATEKMGISYRKAWGSVEEMEEKLGFKLVNRQRGGSQGGKTELTDDGLKLINSHKELREEFNKVIKEITKKFFRELNTDGE